MPSRHMLPAQTTSKKRKARLRPGPTPNAAANVFLTPVCRFLELVLFFSGRVLLSAIYTAHSIRSPCAFSPLKVLERGTTVAPLFTPHWFHGNYYLQDIDGSVLRDRHRTTGVLNKHRRCLGFLPSYTAVPPVSVALRRISLCAWFRLFFGVTLLAFRYHFYAVEGRWTAYLRLEIIFGIVYVRIDNCEAGYRDIHFVLQVYAVVQQLSAINPLLLKCVTI